MRAYPCGQGAHLDQNNPTHGVEGTIKFSLAKGKVSRLNVRHG